MKKTVFTGILLVALMTFVACGEKDNGSQTEDQETLVTYTDIAFARSSAEAGYGRFFSSSEGKSYKDSEVNATNGPKIDLAFWGLGMCYFLSPNSGDIDPAIPGATTTLYLQRAANTSQLSVAQFDAMTTDELLRAITITADDEDSFGTTGYPIILLFKNAAGKKGAIKVKAIDSQRLLVDIKVQK